MKKTFLHIPAVFAALLLCLACSDDKLKVIPKGKMAKIYAEMLVMDQWAVSEPHLRQTADTSLIYEPIFEKYGYDGEDYRFSVEHYMNDPERFSRILRTTSEILDGRINELRELQKTQKRQEEISRFVTDFVIGDYYPYLSSEPYVHYYDSLTVELDTLSTYRLISVERADTLFDCLRMIVPGDSVTVEVPQQGDEVIDEQVLDEDPAPEKEFEVAKPPRKLDKAMPKLLRHSKLDSLRKGQE